MAHYPLRQLEAELQKVIVQTSAEKDAEGKWIWRGDDGEPYYWSTGPTRCVFQDVTELRDADHIMFLCPKCFEKNGGAVGTHRVWVTFAGRNVPDDGGTKNKDGVPTRWNVSGSSLDDLVLTPSILLQLDSCGWHGFVGSSGIPAGCAE